MRGKGTGARLLMAAENALRASGKFIPWQVDTVSCDGRILDQKRKTSCKSL